MGIYCSPTRPPRKIIWNMVVKRDGVAWLRALGPSLSVITFRFAKGFPCQLQGKRNEKKERRKRVHEVADGREVDPRHTMNRPWQPFGVFWPDAFIHAQSVSSSAWVYMPTDTGAGARRWWCSVEEAQQQRHHQLEGSTPQRSTLAHARPRTGGDHAAAARDQPRELQRTPSHSQSAAVTVSISCH